MSNEEKFDGLFMTLVQQSQGIENFYNHLFGFMRRKTDFFTYDDKARDIVMKPLNENLQIYQADKKKEAALKAKQEQEKKLKEQEAEAKKKQGESSAQVEEITDEEAERIIKEEAAKKAKIANEDKAPVEATEEGEEKKEGDEASGKQVPLAGNGGFTDKYKWAQTLEELTVYVALPDLTAAKQLDVKI